MALSGSLREFSLSEILQLLSSQRKTGSLRLTRGTESRVVYLLEGRVASVRDRGFGDDDPLARFLRRVRRLSEEQLRGIASIHAESGRDLVDLLLNGRYMEREELSILYERLVLDVLHEILVWDDGIYSFSNVAPPESALPVSLSTESMLMEAVRRQDELRRYRTRLSDPSLILGLKELPDPDASLTEEEKELFGLVDGRRSLGELVTDAPLTDFEAYEALFRLVESGWIEIQGRRAPERIVPEDRDEKDGLGRHWRIEGALAGACLVLVLVVQILAWRTARPTLPTPNDAYTSLGLRDVQVAIETYRVQNGRYPSRLEELVESGWLHAGQLTPNGFALEYGPAAGGASYSLSVASHR
jgi:hypothetical protein